MINENNCTYLFVGNVTNGYADDADVDISTMPAGSVVLVKLDQTTVKAEKGAIAGTTPFQLINKLSDGTIVRSPEFRLENWVSAGKAVYAPPVEQVSYLGYDGTTVKGLGTITAGNSYIVGLWLNHTKGAYSQQGEVKHISAYATDNLQSTVAKNLMESHLKNFSPIREKNPSIKCERIYSGAQDVALDNLSLTNGSKYFTSADDDTATITAGTIIRFSPVAGVAVDAVSPCYIVVGHDGGVGAARVYELDLPYQAATDADKDEAETCAAGGEWGLKFTGIAQPFSPQADYPVQVNFDVLTDSFGSYGAEYKGVKPFPGHGTYAQLAELEAYTQGNENWYRNSMYPSVDYRREILSTNTYDVITVNFKNSYTSAASGVTVGSPWTAVLAIEHSLNYDALDTALKA